MLPITQTQHKYCSLTINGLFLYIAPEGPGSSAIFIFQARSNRLVGGKRNVDHGIGDGVLETSVRL